MTAPQERTNPFQGPTAVPVLRPVVRLITVLAVGTAVVATFFDTASRTSINPLNFFGFFTMQSNIMTAVVLFVAAILELGKRSNPGWLVPVRAATTTYMVVVGVVGVVYNLLLAGLAGGVDLAWANWVLHVAFPVYAFLDWLLNSDRHRLPLATIGLILVYPLTWCAVVLVRGATDGWVPYPFLDPATGYGSVALYVVLIAGAFAVFGALIIAISRLHVPWTNRSSHTR